MLKTEKRNEKTTHIDKMDTLSMLKIINEENMNSVRAVEAELDNIAKAVDSATECFARGGRMFYIGADSALAKIVDIAICPDTGAEVITGSTRMKGGNAQKFVLNMLSTCAMVKSGYVYENLMINLKPSNIKLKKRMIGIVCDILRCDETEEEKRLNDNEWSIRKVVENN